MDPPSTYRVGLMGAGRWGRNWLRVLGAALVAVVDTDLETRKRLTAEDPRRLLVYASAADPAFWEAVDAVVIATPARFHYEHATLALEHGKHVLVEKPLTMDAATTKALTRHAEDAGRVLHCGYIVPFIGLFQQLVQRVVVDERTIVEDEREVDGPPLPVLHIQCVRTGPGAPAPGCPVTWDLMVHDIAAVFYLLDITTRLVGPKAQARPTILEDVRVSAAGNAEGTLSEVLLTAAVRTHDQRRRRVQVSFSTSLACHEKVRQFRVHTGRRSYMMDDINKQLHEWRDGVAVAVRGVDPERAYAGEPLAQQAEYFRNLCVSGGPLMFSMRALRAITKLADVVSGLLATTGDATAAAAAAAVIPYLKIY